MKFLTTVLSNNTLKYTYDEFKVMLLSEVPLMV